eukprot:COSAG01_NODE_3982_length_5467_cov_3.487891_1_plen_62_part_00
MRHRSRHPPSSAAIPPDSLPPTVPATTVRAAVRAAGGGSYEGGIPRDRSEAMGMRSSTLAH